MRSLNRLLPVLAVIAALAVLALTMSWLAHADRPLRAEVPVQVGAGTTQHRIEVGAVPGQVETATLAFDLPASEPGHWVLWLPRDPLQALRLEGKDADGRDWSAALPGFFGPFEDDGFAPAGYAFVLPPGLAGPQRMRLSLRSELRGAPTPRMVSLDSALRLASRELLFASALYAAWATLLIASLALYWAVRDELFLMHAVYTLTALLFMATLQGHLYALPGAGLLGAMGMRWFWIVVLLFNLCGLWLMLRYAGVEASRSRWVRGLPRLLPLAALPLLLALPPVPALEPVLRVAAPLAWMLSAPASLWAVVDGARRGIPMAVATATALLALLVAAGASLAMAQGWVEDVMLVRHGYQFALVLVSLVLFVGLSSRIGSVRQKLDDETIARLDSEARLRHEQVRAQLAPALQEALRDAPEDRIAATALRLLGAHVGEWLGSSEAVVVAEGYQGHERLFVQAVAQPSATARAVQEARAAVRNHALNREPVHVQLPAAGRDGGGMVDYLVAPLAVPSPGWGALVVPFAGTLSPDDSRALAGLVKMTQGLVEETRSAWQLRRTAERDALTGSLNRRALDKAVAREFKESASQPLAVLFIDIDWFKKVNDTHGHACGDECLRAVAAALRAGLRPDDVLGRYGGEEFLVILPDQDAAAARVVGERLRQSIERMPQRWQAEVLHLTVSIGLAARRPGDDPARLLARADKALYRAKHEGRNRVCAAPAYVD